MAQLFQRRWVIVFQIIDYPAACDAIYELKCTSHKENRIGNEVHVIGHQDICI